MTTLYVALRVVTFFGTVMRTFCEHVACRICKLPIEDARVFKNNELCGHVEHELPENLKQSYLICWLPFTLNFLVGCSFLLTGSYRLFFIGENETLQPYGLVWLGVSLLANCAPSFEDMLSFKDFLYNGKGKLSQIVLSPFFAIVFISSYLEKYSMTFILSIAFAVLFPYAFSVLFPAFESIQQML